MEEEERFRFEADALPVTCEGADALIKFFRNNMCNYETKQLEELLQFCSEYVRGIDRSRGPQRTLVLYGPGRENMLFFVKLLIGTLGRAHFKNLPEDEEALGKCTTFVLADGSDITLATEQPPMMLARIVGPVQTRRPVKKVAEKYDWRTGSQRGVFLNFLRTMPS